MRNIEIRPYMRTAGGEANDILMDGRFMGTLMLVYREGDRVAGSVQLEQESLPPADKQRVVAFVQDYIQAFIHAVQAESCDVLVTYSSYDHVVMTGEEEDPIGLEADDSDWVSDDYEDFELVLVSERQNRIHYRIYTADGEEAADARLQYEMADIAGEVTWQFEPDDHEIEKITELLVSDYDEDTVDTFVIQHLYGDALLETVELTHERLLDEDEDEQAVQHFGSKPAERYSVALVRDDGDVLTYEIYERASGSLPIGTATIDIQESRLSGFIDFRERNLADNAGAIAEVLMRELDKEKDEYHGLHLSLMYKNQFLDEFNIENETIH
jgi:hypothetical protein